METAVRWNQRSTPSDPRFLIVDVPGRTLKLCHINSFKGDSVQWREISKNTRVPQFRAFDWNFLHNVVAVGQWSGEVNILGLKNGDPMLPITLKTQRSCNSVAFNSDALLATGLDRVRNDHCLNIYDIGHWARSSADSFPSRQPVTDPYRKLAVSEGIASIKFFIQQPTILVTGVKGVGIRIYDLRENQTAPAVYFSTACVHNIAIDPCNSNYFASAAPPKEATVQIWDRRSAPRQSSSVSGQSSGFDTPLLELPNIFKHSSTGEPPSVWSLRYSIAEQGSLGVLGNHGSVRIFDTKRDWVDVERGSDVRPDDIVSEISVTRTESLGFVSQTQEQEAPLASNKVFAFDFINMLSSSRRPIAMTLHASQDVRLQELHSHGSVVATSFASRASIAISKTKGRSKTGLSVFRASQSGSISEALQDINERLRRNSTRSSESSDDESGNDGWTGSGEDSKARADTDSISRFGRRGSDHRTHASVKDALIIAERSRRRCLEGYLLDPDINAEIVHGNRELQLMWRWISVAKGLANSGNLARGSINLNYLGILNVWQNNIGTNSEARLRPGIQHGDIRKMIIDLAKDLNLPKIEIPETEQAYHRWLCLYILGFDSTPEVLLEDVKRSALAGNNSAAALHALLARDSALAATALRSGPRKTQNKALSLLLSIDSASEDRDDRASLLEQIENVIGSTKDPFIQAIKYLLTTRISSSKVTTIPDIKGLPPQYHIGLAFLLLPDRYLKQYLELRHRIAVNSGLLSYIPLTGLSQLSLRIFKRYLVHTGDLQSVVLALSYVCPLYIDKPRMQYWRSEYRSNLNRYGLYIKRAQFDMQTTKLAQRPDGTTALAPQSRQISLKCLNCDGSLHREPDRLTISQETSATSVSTPTTTTFPPPLLPSTSDPSIPTIVNDSLSPYPADSLSTQNLDLPIRAGFLSPTSPNPQSTPQFPPKLQSKGRLILAPKDGTLCPKCGARMPRCAVCEIWTGETDARSAALLADAQRDSGDGKGRDLLEGFVEVCLRCKHVYHRAHAEDWFGRNKTCAAVGCNCTCDSRS